jgi:nitrite reductase/ring-hydroxylating ferredoxin subunit
MEADENWVDIGSTDELSGPPLRRINVANRELAISLKDGKFGAVSNICNHAGGPLGESRLDGDYIVCPWRNFTAAAASVSPVSSATAFPPTR